MEVMTYILWVLLLIGSVMKNDMVAASLPKSGQALPAVDRWGRILLNDDSENVIEVEFQQAVNDNFNNQTYGWVDTS
ncbi:hypothetical protein [Fictibacillus phosphorivorans]|uniref:hypothetical protein n=1 Tax=Fictibacillus phosphorivorans TaxID=1221500 RepID=UPI0020425298|nr:hypothetical protein [Fictibacillus phosphorivorans]MCM3720261.1 hypothetical protein [Fictibacillus phosphorivorans]MCM3777943.1 hypothetical protein [Fictibacillus phosphorivorans]